jgi:hypothetical protein
VSSLLWFLPEGADFRKLMEIANEFRSFDFLQKNGEL